VQRLEEALDGLQQALTSPPRLEQPWRQIVRDRLATVGEELTAEHTVATDSWLSARAGHLDRERDRLVARLAVLSSRLGESGDVEALRTALQRLVLDVTHHHGRVTDLLYDAYAMDVGGSE
jgi:hypothetical protein